MRRREKAIDVYKKLQLLRTPLDADNVPVPSARDKDEVAPLMVSE